VVEDATVVVRLALVVATESTCPDRIGEFAFALCPGLRSVEMIGAACMLRIERRTAAILKSASTLAQIGAPAFPGDSPLRALNVPAPPGLLEFERFRQ
jgi:hypothetical protein